MLAETEGPELTEKVLARMDEEKLAGLLAVKTEHLMVASRCQLPDMVLQPLRREVEMMQAELNRRNADKSPGPRSGQ